MPHFGTIRLPCEYGGRKFMCKFFLCDIEGLLLGLPTCEDLGIVTISIAVKAKNENEINAT